MINRILSFFLKHSDALFGIFIALCVHIIIYKVLLVNINPIFPYAYELGRIVLYLEYLLITFYLYLHLTAAFKHYRLRVWKKNIKPNKVPIVLCASALILFIISYSEIQWLFSQAYWGETPANGGDTRSALFRNIGLTIFAPLAIFLAFKRTKSAEKQVDTAIKQAQIATDQWNLAEKGHKIDRFQKGVEMLADEKQEVRIAGIIALGNLAKDAPWQYHRSIMDILTVRLKSITKPGMNSMTSPDGTVTFPHNPEIQEIMNVIGSRSEQQVQVDHQKQISLDNLILDVINFSSANFTRVSFNGAQFYGCSFNQCKIDFITKKAAHMANCIFFQCEFISHRTNMNIHFRDCVLAECHICNHTFLGSDTFINACESNQISGSDLQNITPPHHTIISQSWSWRDTPQLLPANTALPETHLVDRGQCQHYSRSQKYGLPNGRRFQGFGSYINR